MGDTTEIDWTQWGKTVSEALAGGARASIATVFVSAGGSSYGIMLIWAGGDALSRLDQPRERARLSIAVEEELPGWLWKTNSIPSKRDPVGWALADYSLGPFDRSDGGLVRLAVKGQGGKAGELGRALDLLDAFAGAPSWRILVDGLMAVEDLGKGKRPSDSALGVPKMLAGGAGPADFAMGMAARACQLALKSGLGTQPEEEPEQKRRAGRRV